MTLKPNPFYYGRKARVNLFVPSIANDQTQYNDYLAGGLDITSIPSSYVSHWKGKDVRVDQVANEWLMPDLRTKPFNNVHCRLAVAYALDRNSISKQVLKGTSIPSYTVVPRGAFGHYSGKDNPHFDTTKARAELAQCPGQLNGVQIAYQHTSTDYDDEFSAIQSMLAAIGANVKLLPMNLNDWLTVVTSATMNHDQVAIVQDNWFDDYPDASDFLDNILKSGAAYNLGGFHNVRFDRLVSQADSTANRTTRASLYRKAQHIALMSGAYISVRQYSSFYLVKPTLHGFEPNQVFNTLWPKGGSWANISVGH